MKRWANGQRFTWYELWLWWSLRRAGCHHLLPLFGCWDDNGVWRVRCRLGCVKGGARYDGFRLR